MKRKSPLPFLEPAFSLKCKLKYEIRPVVSERNPPTEIKLQGIHERTSTHELCVHNQFLLPPFSSCQMFKSQTQVKKKERRKNSNYGLCA